MGLPYYEQVASVLRAHILSLDVVVPVYLPTERDLSRMYHTSRGSVRQALELLESDGLIQRTPGRGTLTVPSGIRAWLRTRQSKLITVVALSTMQMEPQGFYGRIYQGVARRSQEVGFAVSIRQMAGEKRSIPVVHAMRSRLQRGKTVRCLSL